MASSAKIATLTLNPAVDQTAKIDNFAIDTVNRVSKTQSDAGGKGVNVASFLAHFAYPVAATGLLGSKNQDLFSALFAEKGIDDHFVKVSGSTRVNIKIVDDAKNQVTDVNFPGADVSEKDVQAVSVSLSALAKDGVDVFVLAGSLPNGVPVEFYANQIKQLKGLGKRVVLDTSGPALAAAIAQGPDVIKPNIDELQELTGETLDSRASIVEAARKLNETVALVVISMGAEGALFVTKNEAVLAVPPEVQVKSTVGAGDAMVAGIVHSMVGEKPLADIARLSTSFSLGALGEIGPRLPDLATIEAFQQQVKIENFDQSS